MSEINDGTSKPMITRDPLDPRGHRPEVIISGPVQIEQPPPSPPAPPAHLTLTTTAEQALIPAPGAGLSIVVTDITGSNEGTLLSRLEFREGPGGTVRYQFAMAARGGGFALPMRTAWKLPANTGVYVRQSAVGSAYVSANYYIE